MRWPPASIPQPSTHTHIHTPEKLEEKGLMHSVPLSLSGREECKAPPLATLLVFDSGLSPSLIWGNHLASPLSPETLTLNYVSLPLWLLSQSNPFLVNIHALPGLPLPTFVTLLFSHQKPGQWQRPRMGNGKETGILVLFHLRTASRNGGKTAPVNYIITAASTKRTGIQVAIVFVSMLLERQSSRPCSLAPFPSIFLTNLSRVASYF